MIRSLSTSLTGPEGRRQRCLVKGFDHCPSFSIISPASFLLIQKKRFNGQIIQLGVPRLSRPNRQTRYGSVFPDRRDPLQLSY
ncbi:MAG: hypothetical protein EZS28_031577 [Streblomastix strix]|uniref:Uncharacterized protein n=1 Tax=Streblomastix strix TaxID=222440 RepID=A0A5J4UR85_9EUKA|nr:MAG: hypothetical protein EZS28_031577 [Streblomastix strix]